MERICGNLTSADDERQCTRHCHVDAISVAVACGVALLTLVCVVYLRLARADSTKRPRLLRGHVFRCLVALLLFLALLLELADALLSTPTSWHVLATPATTLLSWVGGVVLYYHVESRRRDGLLGLLVVGWTLCAASRILRLAYLLTLRLDATSARPWTAFGVATLFGVLAVTDAYTLYMAACRRRTRKHEFPGCVPGNVIYRHREASFYNKATFYIICNVFTRVLCCVQACRRRTRKPEFPGCVPGNVIYRHREASFYNKATFYWLTSLLRRGYSNPLELEDLGVLPHEETTEEVFDKFKHIYDEEKHQAKREQRRCSLWRCYFRSCWPMFALGGVLKLLGDLVGLVGPLGISVIIEYVRTLRGEARLDGHTDGGSNLGFPLLGDLLDNGYVMSVVVFLSCIAQGTFSQSSTHLVNVEGIHLKGSLQALVYSKALRLSVWSISDQKEEVEANGVLHKGRPTKAVEKSVTSTDLGTITNLMSEDAFNVMSFFWIGHYVWAIPLKIGVLMYLLYLKLGLSAIIGAAFCILTMTPLQFLIGKKMSTNSKAIIEMSDERLKKINEVLQGVKLLKLYGWECVYGSRIAQTRKKELVLLDRDSLYWALMTFLTQASSVMVTLVTFGVYFATVGPSLSAGDVFAGLALFNQLTVPLFIFPITVPIIISALVSTDRLEDFLSLPETATPSADDVVASPTPIKEDVAVQEVAYAQDAEAPKSRENSVFGLDDILENEEEPDEDEDVDVDGEEGEDQEECDVTVSVRNGCFSWSGDNRISLNTKNIVVSAGKLTLVVGKVGSGKTSFLSALLGEMFTISGKVQWEPGVSVAYAAQRPWLLNASLRDNILFGQPYRPRRYNRVIRACALQPDIDILPGKDLTEIGEKGINLSGGQKQRVSIARALYTWATVVILDDPLSALDYQVAQQVFEDGIKKLLLRQRRTVILVTHSLQLLPHAHKIIALENGSVRVQGSLAEIGTADPQLAQTWRAIMSREALEEQTRGRTARERWQLVKLVSRIGVQLKQRNVVDGSWQTEEEEHVTKPLFVPFRKRRGTFSGSRGSRYFSHDLPLPTDECEDEECLIRPKRMSLKRGRALTATCPLGVSALPQHKQVLRSSSLQTHDFLPYPVVRQLSSPTMHQHEQLLTGNCRTRNFTVDNAVQTPFLKRILSIKSKRNTWAASDFPAPITREHSVLKRLLSSKPSTPALAPVAAKPEQLRVKRLQSTGSTYSEDFNDEEEGYDDATDAGAGRLMSEEEREYGKIPRRIYWVYLCACGVTAGLGYIVSTIVWQGLRVYTDYWLSEWADFTNSTSEYDTEHVLDEKETLKYFTTYAIMSVASIFLSLSSNGIGQYAGAQARRTLHDKMLLNLLRCPVRFFETTPVGRIINRFSTDMGVIDRKIATTIQRLLQFLLLCFSAIVVNAVVAPWFLLVAVPICVIYFVIQRFYRSSARELQRLDSITRSPIFSHFSETLGGLTTIRAFSHQRRFTAMLHHKMDTHTNVFLIINTGNRWLGIALDYLGGVIVFVAIVASLLSATFIPSITPALVGFAINYTLLVPIYLNWVVKFLADMEMYMGAVERVEQYAHTPREDYREQGLAVQPRWPEKGDIVFSGVSLRYDVNREPVVSNFNLHIPAGQKVGICGRTGSGKSSLAMSLFNMVDVFEGNILIDGVDINQVPLQVLRARLSIIPQDVIMFSGTVRSNLDPSSQYSDEKLWMSLELAQLKGIVAGYPGGLDGEVREGGENLSAGERQLFCLARAILHDAACLVMDEATSSVDPATEKALLAAATRAFASRTVITIAHRLSTILDCDRILVLDDGRIVEEGTPKQLLNRSMGIFSSMLRASEETTVTP